MNLFDELIGEQLSAVTFVQDYFQLWFDGPGINVNNPTIVYHSGIKNQSWNNGFRDAVCGQISKIVESVLVRKEDSVKIVFNHQSYISISLKPDDYDSPEAIFAHGFENEKWIVL